MNEALLREAYRAFNARDVDAALATMHPDVEWPNGMEGGYVHGHEEVRRYWTRQWGLIDPLVEPIRFATDDSGLIVLDVRQVVRDLRGTVIAQAIVQHAYLVEDGLVRRMEIRKIAQPDQPPDHLPDHPPDHLMDSEDARPTAPAPRAEDAPAS